MIRKWEKAKIDHFDIWDVKAEVYEVNLEAIRSTANSKRCKTLKINSSKAKHSREAFAIISVLDLTERSVTLLICTVHKVGWGISPCMAFWEWLKR